MSADSIGSMCHQVIHNTQAAPLLTWRGLQILPGLNAVTGDEGSGKTRLLRELSESTSDALWLDLRLPEHDEHAPEEVWAQLQSQCPRWNATLCAELAEALNLQEHMGKRLYMLSAGSRRKVALVGLLASGSTLTCLDQPSAALDLASIQVLREFLQDMTDHTTRAWVVADYEADTQLNWGSLVSMRSAR